MSEKLKAFPHHHKVGPCNTRPPYRDGKRKRAVKVYTIADESMYLLIFGVPSINLSKVLKERIQNISPVLNLRKVDHPEEEVFTETFLAKFDSVVSARTLTIGRNVRKRLDDSSFYGGFLHIVYAPEHESVAECRIKMHSYRRFNDAVYRKFLAMKSCENARQTTNSVSQQQRTVTFNGLGGPPTPSTIPPSHQSTPSLPATSVCGAGSNHHHKQLGYMVAVSQSSPSTQEFPHPYSRAGPSFQLDQAIRVNTNTFPRPQTHAKGTPLAVQQALLCQPIINGPTHESPPTPSCPRPSSSKPLDSVSLSSEMAKFTPRSVAQAKRRAGGSASAIKRRKLT